MLLYGDRNMYALPRVYECIYCKSHTMCVWSAYEDEVIEDTEADIACDMAIQQQMMIVPNNLKRKRAYQVFVSLVYGRLGRNKRVKLPACVKKGIRRNYPSGDGNYMGHRDK